MQGVSSVSAASCPLVSMVRSLLAHMPKRLLPSLLLLLSAAACVEEPNIPRLGDKPIQLTLSTSSSVLGPGEVITITAHITNTLSEPASLLFPTLCEVRVFIRDDRGTLVVPENGTHDCPNISTQLNLQPQGTVTREFTWSGGGQLNSPSTATRLPPGQYFVSATLDAVDYSTVAFAVTVTLTP